MVIAHVSCPCLSSEARHRCSMSLARLVIQMWAEGYRSNSVEVPFRFVTGDEREEIMRRRAEAINRRGVAAETGKSTGPIPQRPQQGKPRRNETPQKGQGNPPLGLTR